MHIELETVKRAPTEDHEYDKVIEEYLEEVLDEVSRDRPY